MEFKKAQAMTIECKGCGAPMVMRVPGKTQSVACQYCGSVIDVTGSAYAIISKFETNANIKPLFEFGSRGVFNEIEYEFIGFMRKKDDEGAQWDEYLLFNPYSGYRFLSNWRGHWNLIQLLQGAPSQSSGDDPVLKPEGVYAVRFQDQRYAHFASYKATVLYVLGEFYWRVKKGDENWAHDFVHEPFILSQESSIDQTEAVWSLGEYKLKEEIEQAFQLPEKLPKPEWIAPNQPNPFRRKKSFYGKLMFGCLAVLLGLQIFSSSTSENAFLSSVSKSFNISMAEQPLQTSGGTQYKERQVELGEFEISGSKPQNLEFHLDTDVANEWVFVTFFIMNEDKNKGYAFNQEVSYYYGSSGGESWTEGSKKESFDTVKLEPGKYFIIGMVQTSIGVKSVNSSLRLDVRIHRDTSGVAFFIFAIFLLPIPWIIYLIRFKSFENQR